MKRLRRLLRLTTTEQWLLIKTALLLEVIKPAMHLLPFRFLRRLVDEGGKMPSGLQQCSSVLR
jgi:hypothetical protein